MQKPSTNPTPPSRNIYRLALAAIALLLTALAATSDTRADEAADRESLRLRKVLLEEARAAAQRQRDMLFQQALIISHQQKQAAQTERERLEQQIKRLEHDAAVSDWALGDFERGLRPKYPTISRIAPYQRYWLEAREQSKNTFLRLPEQSRGAILEGRALNFFFDLLGDVAVQHEVMRKQLRETGEMRDAQLLAARDRAEHGNTAEKTAATAEIQRIEQSRAETQRHGSEVWSNARGQARREDPKA